MSTVEPSAEPIFRFPPVIIHSLSAPPDALAGPEWWVADWSLEKPLGAADAMGEGILVGILDTGMDPTHAASGALAGAVAGGRNFTSASQTDFTDRVGHGTAVASVVAGRAPHLQGIAPSARIMVAKVLGDQGEGSDQGVAAGLSWLASQGCHVINGSLGGPINSPRIKQVVESIDAAGILQIYAAGNSGAGAVDFPAALDACGSAGAVDRRKVVARFSNTGNYVDAVAPGVEMRMAFARGGYSIMSGTSFASPWLSGLIARRLAIELKVLGAVKTRSTAALMGLFERYCDDLGTDGRDPEYGYGFLNPATFLDVQKPAPPPVVPPSPTPPAPGPCVLPAEPVFAWGGFQVYGPVKVGDKTGIFLPIE